MSAPLRKPHAPRIEGRSPSPARPPLSSEIRARPPGPAPSSPFDASRPPMQEPLALVQAPVVRELRREELPPPIAKPRAQPPPLPAPARASRAMPPPLPTAPPAVSVAVTRISWQESSPAEDLPDFLNGAARRRRVIWTVLAVAALALLAAFGATIASHFRPM